MHGVNALSTFLAVLLGLAAGWVLPWQRLLRLLNWQSHDTDNLRALFAKARQRLRLSPALPPQVEAQAPAEPEAPASPLARLHVLESAIEAFGQSLSHPAELLEHAEFKQAVQLLRDPAVSMLMVTHYALGVSWALNSAALVALEERPDRG